MVYGVKPLLNKNWNNNMNVELNYCKTLDKHNAKRKFFFFLFFKYKGKIVHMHKNKNLILFFIQRWVKVHVIRLICQIIF